MESGFFKVGVASLKGFRRTMEDEHLVEPNLGKVQGGSTKQEACFGIFDGHSGPKASKYVKDHILSFFLQQSDRYDDLFSAWRITVLRTEREFLQDVRHKDLEDGTTLLICYIIENELYTINLGDSRAILSRAGAVVRLSTDIRPNDVSERTRIELAGGKVSPSGRVLGLLGVSRSIGDIFFKDKSVNGISSNLLVAEPVIQKRILSKHDEFIVLACDGLFDVMSSQDVRDFVSSELESSHGDVDAVAAALANQALKIGSKDNISIVIVLIKPGTFTEEASDEYNEIDFAASKKHTASTRKKKKVRKHKHKSYSVNTSETSDESKEEESAKETKESLVGLSDWRPGKVAKWIKSLSDGAESYASLFKKAGIDGGKLITMTKSDLQELGIDKLGLRIKIHKEIETLRTQSNLHAPAAVGLAELYMKGISSWGPNDVASWLENIELGEYSEHFIKAKVQGANLINFTKKELSELGIIKLGHRIRILKAIKVLDKSEGHFTDPL
eukprot:TRINITY_DN2692_c0_g1_i3.p1 TRINITY_DN2692_c0_g1~~TRINITY_DN2692_c0_g1_i3.p1  ORF type:complete len:501 (-),score=75.39 TRINITY_DN2692_c0_g1_i3:31-1533(-)